jgi:DNA-directed RNA polymerase beta' subunit
MQRWTPSSAVATSDACPILAPEQVARIVGFRAGIMAPEEVERIQACAITDHQINHKNIPKLNGPNDPAMGPPDRRVRCSTCFHGMFRCPGHHGIIRLPIHLYPALFIEPILKTLQTVCWVCGCILGPMDDPRILRHLRSRGIVRFAQAYVGSCNKRSCARCGGLPQPSYARAGATITRTWKPAQLETLETKFSPALALLATRIFTPTDALEILSIIPDEHVRIMGMDVKLSHPKNMILHNLAVLPPNARPAIMQTEGSKRRGEDDITDIYQQIVKDCKLLRKLIHTDKMGIFNITHAHSRNAAGGKASVGSTAEAAGTVAGGSPNRDLDVRGKKAQRVAASKKRRRAKSSSSTSSSASSASSSSSSSSSTSASSSDSESDSEQGVSHNKNGATAPKSKKGTPAKGTSAGDAAVTGGPKRARAAAAKGKSTVADRKQAPRKKGRVGQTLDESNEDDAITAAVLQTTSGSLSAKPNGGAVLSAYDGSVMGGATVGMGAGSCRTDPPLDAEYMFAWNYMVHTHALHAQMQESSVGDGLPTHTAAGAVLPSSRHHVAGAGAAAASKSGSGSSRGSGDGAVPSSSSVIPLSTGQTTGAGVTHAVAAATGGVLEPTSAQAAASAGVAAAVNEVVKTTARMPATMTFELSVEEVEALRAGKRDTVCSISSATAAAIWTAYPVACAKLQDDVIVLHDNTGKYAPQAKQRTNVAKRTLSARFVKKEGRFRGNMQAKRGDQNGRSVICPDGAFDVNEVGLPDAFMNTLTTPETVNQGNLQRLTEAVRLGPGVAFGAMRVLRITGELLQLSRISADRRAVLQLQYGDMVERHLIDGDAVCLNRQPSLHRLSYMAHKVRRVHMEAVTMALAVMPPYNADCDGDEINVHVLQSLPAQAEAKRLMAVSRNVMNPQNNAPCLSLVQNSRVGAMLITQRHRRFTLDQMCQVMGAIHYKVAGKETLPPPMDTDPVTGDPLWLGKQVATLLLPPGIFLEKRVRGAGPDVGPDDPDERYVLVENGVLVHGALCKATIGTSGDGLVQKINKIHGAAAVCNFLSDFQRVVAALLPHIGLTFGLEDCIVSSDTKKRLAEVARQADATVEQLTKDKDELTRYLTPHEAGRLEAQITNILTAVLDFGSRRVLSDKGPDNTLDHRYITQYPSVLRTLDEAHCPATGFRSMVAAGSKGSSNNVPQVTAYLGQQIVNGERMPKLPHSGRTLPMFPRGAPSATARGFITQSYLGGMRPPEYFAHMQGGREGLVATAVKTANIGYIDRCMASGCMNNILAWDGTIRNAQQHIVEFEAGGDYMTSTEVEVVQLHALKATNADIERSCGSNAARVRQLRDSVRASRLTPMFMEMNEKALLPVNLKDECRRIEYDLASRQTRFAAPRGDAGDDAALEAEVRSIVEEVARYLPSRECMAELELALLYDLRPEVLRKHNIDLHTVRQMLRQEVIQHILNALAQPGESVGVIACQSIGEPSTQFTLNAFHQAGLMQRRLQVGVKRLQELVFATEKIQTPSMLLPFKTGADGKPLYNAETRALLASSLQFLRLDTVLHSSSPQRDPAGDGQSAPCTTIFKDAKLMMHVIGLYGTELEAATRILGADVVAACAAAREQAEQEEKEMMGGAVASVEAVTNQELTTSSATGATLLKAKTSHKKKASSTSIAPAEPGRDTSGNDVGGGNGGESSVSAKRSAGHSKGKKSKAGTTSGSGTSSGAPTSAAGTGPAHGLFPSSKVHTNTSVLSDWIIRLVLNRALLSEHGYTPEMVAAAIAKQMTGHQLVIIFSQPNMTRWVIRVRIIGGPDTNLGERATRRLHAEMRESVLLSGVAGIKRSQVVTLPKTVINSDTGAVEQTTIDIIDTTGSALMKMATREWIDWNNCISNDVQEVASTLGIIAARAVLFAELNHVISYDGGYVDPRHLWQVVSTMTHRGFVMKLNRFGINRVDFSVLQRAAYEEPVMMLVEGALGAEHDPIRGTSEAIMFGQKAPLGTGTVEIQVDVDAGAPAIFTPRVTVASREQDLLRGARKRFRENLIDGNAADAGTSHLEATQLASSLITGPRVYSTRRNGVLPTPDTLHLVRIAPDGVREIISTDADFVPMSPRQASTPASAVHGAAPNNGAQAFPTRVSDTSGGLRRVVFQPSSPNADDLYEIGRLMSMTRAFNGHQ